MCYMILLSTDSDKDLSAENDDLVLLCRELPGLPEEDLLEYEYRWFVGSRNGCSCGFRHLSVESVGLGFGEAVEWYPEESEDLQATRKFISLVRGLAEQGARVDCIDAWHHSLQQAKLAGTIQVELSLLNDLDFRFYESHRFVFVM